ncbi:hypothetical protein EDB89DRAFT_2063862 [Lactarius sanguifluus]|nr:hypothetical protein EDB89DRAFT_2063862 [Lactarius sanguifluus]
MCPTLHQEEDAIHHLDPDQEDRQMEPEEEEEDHQGATLGESSEEDHPEEDHPEEDRPEEVHQEEVQHPGSKAPARVPPRHRIRITAVACRVIAAPLPPSIVSSSSSSSFELALAALPSCRRSPFLPSCRRSPLLNRRRRVVVIVAGVIRCVVVAVGMAVTGRRCRVWDRTYAGEFVVVVVEHGKPPWPVATFSTPAR